MWVSRPPLFPESPETAVGASCLHPSSQALRQVPPKAPYKAEYRLGQKHRRLGGQRGPGRQPAQQPQPFPPHPPSPTLTHPHLPRGLRRGLCCEPVRQRRAPLGTADGAVGAFLRRRGGGGRCPVWGVIRVPAMVLGSSLSAVYDSLVVPGLAASSYWKAARTSVNPPRVPQVVGGLEPR